MLEDSRETLTVTKYILKRITVRHADFRQAVGEG